MKERKPPVTARQPSETARVVLTAPGGLRWNYMPSKRTEWSEPFKTREEATRAALAAGFAAVFYNGEIVARREPSA